MTATTSLPLPLVNAYLAHKQHLLHASRLADVVQVARDIVALHATVATGPYLSLWARVPGFERPALEQALYESRELTRLLCMRVTLHAVPSDQIPFFLRACQTYIERQSRVAYRGAALLAQAGLCQPAEAEALLRKLHCQVLDVLAERGPATVREITEAMPELQVKIRHDVGKRYEGEFSVGSRLVPRMCASGLLVRARPRGTWRSNLYEYAALSDWLPNVDPASVSPQEARAWLVCRYISAFGPATPDDVQWWTGFTKTDTRKALKTTESTVVRVAIESLDDGYLMLADDVRRLREFTPPDSPYVFLLPNLDPYVMGYRDRSRFLAPEHHTKIYDRAGNAVPTVWVDGRIAGIWRQNKEGRVIYAFFEPVSEKQQALLAAEVRRLEAFLDGEHLPPRFHTPFTRTLG